MLIGPMMVCCGPCGMLLWNDISSLYTILLSLVICMWTRQCSACVFQICSRNFFLFSYYIRHSGIFEIVLWMLVTLWTLWTYVCSIASKGVCRNFRLFYCFQIQWWRYRQCHLLPWLRSFFSLTFSPVLLWCMPHLCLQILTSNI